MNRQKIKKLVCQNNEEKIIQIKKARRLVITVAHKQQLD